MVKGYVISEQSKKELKEKCFWCALCGTTNDLQIDHKDGRKSGLKEDRVIQTDEAQFLCRHCNILKRERCKECRETDDRFDAKKLGYSISVIEGSLKFQPKDIRCNGCFFFDPIKFRKKLNKKRN